MVAGTIVKDTSHTVGILFGKDILNDTYAQSFRDAYLPQNNEVLFITATHEIAGSTIKDPQTNKLLQTYLQNQDTPTNKEIVSYIKTNAIYYKIYLIPLTEGDSTGGYIVVLQPSKHESSIIVAAALIALLFILIASFIHHTILKKGWGTKTFLPLVFITLFIFYSIFFIFIIRFDRFFTLIRPSPYLLYNSTIALSPDSGIFDTEAQQHIAVRINTGAEFINAVDARIHYDPTRVQILDISTTNSFCNKSLILTKTIDATTGTADISCLVTNPGFSGSDGTVADILIKPLQEGAFTLSFDPETQVLANDGLGTNVLRLATSGQYTITDPSDNDTQLFSITHPNSTRWYNTPTARFNWTPTENAQYNYTLDTNPLEPTVFTNTTTASTITLDTISDGIHYFHLQPIKDGKKQKTLTYKISIDTTPPEKPQITVSDATLSIGDVARVVFTSSDALSGLQKIFYAKIGTSLFLPTKPPLSIPALSHGTIPVTIRVFDQAGNFSDATTTITVR